MRTEITEGATLPDYELPDQTDTLRKLSFLQGDDPMILTFNRGVYCPKDRQQLLQLADFSKQCAVGYTRIVTVPMRQPDDVERSALRGRGGLDFPARRAPGRTEGSGHRGVHFIA